VDYLISDFSHLEPETPLGNLLENKPILFHGYGQLESTKFEG